MKIDHSCRKPYMAETLLYIQKALAILQEMRSRTMPQGMYGDGLVECGPCQGILHNDTDISGLDRLRCHSSAMCLEDEVVTGISFRNPPYERMVNSEYSITFASVLKSF